VTVLPARSARRGLDWLGGLRTYGWVARTTVRSNLAYLGEVGARAVFLAIILFIFLQLWRVTYAGTGEARLGGLTLAQMVWYLMVTECITLSSVRVSAEVDGDVRTGALAVQLLRPLSYPLYRLSTTLAERTVRFALNLAVGVPLALLLAGPISLTPLGLLGFLVALPLAFLLDFLAYFLVGLAAFRLEDTSGLALVYSRVAMILGGTLIPLDLFPEGVQGVLKALPFASMIYGPSRLFVHPEAGTLSDLLLRQGAAVLVLAVLVTVAYRAGVGRIHSNGG
jgi:ABC-2 type transport system permease protein